MQADCDGFFTHTFGTRADAFRRAYPAVGADCGAAVKALLRDRGLAGTSFWASTRLKTGHQPVYVYLYDHTEPGPDSTRYGAFHSSEIPYVFDTLDKSPERGFTDKDRSISAAMSAYWLNFVKSGDPNGPDLAKWPAFNAQTNQIMELGDAFRARDLLDPAKLKVMEDYAASGGRAGIL
jgi:para-nitrobenzyl esterase